MKISINCSPIRLKLDWKPNGSNWKLIIDWWYISSGLSFHFHVRLRIIGHIWVLWNVEIMIKLCYEIMVAFLLAVTHLAFWWLSMELTAQVRENAQLGYVSD